MTKFINEYRLYFPRYSLARDNERIKKSHFTLYFSLKYNAIYDRRHYYWFTWTQLIVITRRIIGNCCDIARDVILT